jgi:hypothetical protein
MAADDTTTDEKVDFDRFTFDEDTRDVFVKKSVRWAIRGFEEAAERFGERERAGLGDPALALAEAIMWLDVLAQEAPALLGSPIIKAMTFARCRNHHWLASLIEEFPESEGDPFRWRTADFFRVADPRYANERGERAYEAVLADQVVTETLAAASRAIQTLIQ